MSISKSNIPVANSYKSDEQKQFHRRPQHLAHRQDHLPHNLDYAALQLTESICTLMSLFYHCGKAVPMFSLVAVAVFALQL